MYRTKVQNTKGEQGIALVSTLLIAMALVTALVGITSVVVMNAKRTTTDESLVLAAQYAAEAGLTQAQTRVLEFSELLGNSAMTNDMTISSMENFAKQYCATYNLDTVPPVGQWTDLQVKNGFELCDVSDVTQASFDIFEDTIDSSIFEDMDIMSNASAAQVTDYWSEILGGGITFNQMVDPNRSVDLTFGFEPVAVRVLADGGRRFVFRQGETKAIGSVLGENGEILASRTISLQPSQNEFYVDYGKPSFAYYNLFVEDYSGFVVGSTAVYGGPVHLNGDTDYTGGRFYTKCSDNQQAAIFHSIFSTVKKSPSYVGGGDCSGDVNQATMFRSDHEFGADYIPLPENTNNQKRAVSGEDHTDSSVFSDEQLRQAFKVDASGWTQGGIYYSHGNEGDAANTSNNWLGGIYVNGSVKNLELSTNQYGRQVIKITPDLAGEITGYEWYRPCYYCSWKQRAVYSLPDEDDFETTRFEQDRYSDNWIVTKPDGSTQDLDEHFNGLIYVKGNIGRRCVEYGNTSCSNESGKSQASSTTFNNGYDKTAGLRGDGTDQPDLASNTRITITATGDIILRQNITYTDDPVVLGLAAKNVLGLYSNGGSIKMDSPWNTGVELDATMMAVAPGKGWGAIDYAGRRGNSKPTMNLLGGIIHYSAQGYGKSNSNYGYNLNLREDPRYVLGYAPPFFPTQTTWTSRVSSGLFNHGATWQYGN